MGESIIEFVRLLDQAKLSIYLLIGFAVILISYIILFALPVLAYIRAANYIKAEAEAQHKGTTSGALVAAKALIATMIVTTMLYSLFFYIFIDMIGLGETPNEIVQKLMFLNLFK